MTAFTPDYLQMPPRLRVPTWMLDDKESMEAWAQDIRRDMLAFPVKEPPGVRNDEFGIKRMGAE